MRRQVAILNQNLKEDGFDQARSIHGEKDQKEREFILKEFRNSKNNILIATDVASRGLDVKDIAYVINYDMP